MRSRNRAGRGIVQVAGLLAALGTSCSTDRVVTNTVRTAMQQLVVSEATDRALARLRWPSLPGQRVFVETRSSAALEDQAYLEGAVQAELAARGAAIVSERADADLVVVALSGALGTEQTLKFFGIPRMEGSVLLPVPVPEIAFFKSKRQDGFAKVEIQLRDPKSPRLLYRDGPQTGEAYWTEFSVLLVGLYRTNTTRRPPGILDTLRTVPGHEPPPAPRPAKPPTISAPAN